MSDKAKSTDKALQNAQNPQGAIVLIEDDVDLNTLLAARLRAKGYEVFAYTDTSAVKSLLDEKNIDLMLVDRNLPLGKDGIDFVAALRKHGYNEPVIFLTAKTLQSDILQGFEQGGDDYITKPFDFNELCLRIKALLKRSKKQVERLHFKDIMLDLGARECVCGGQRLILSSLEFELLRFFLENKGEILSRQELSEAVWGELDTNDKAINIALTRLRAKLPALKAHIQSIRGVGYRLC